MKFHELTQSLLARRVGSPRIPIWHTLGTYILHNDIVQIRLSIWDHETNVNFAVYQSGCFVFYNTNVNTIQNRAVAQLKEMIELCRRNNEDIHDLLEEYKFHVNEVDPNLT